MEISGEQPEHSDDVPYTVAFPAGANEELRKISPPEIQTNGQVSVTFQIKNVGVRAGDEVAQLYFHQTTSSVTTYLLNLCDFARVSLQPGEMKTVAMTIHSRELEIINRNGRRVVEPGKFTVHVGASSEDLRLNGNFTVNANATPQ